MQYVTYSCLEALEMGVDMVPTIKEWESTLTKIIEMK